MRADAFQFSCNRLQSCDFYAGISRPFRKGESGAEIYISPVHLLLLLPERAKVTLPAQPRLPSLYLFNNALHRLIRHW